jgi:phage terminase large subunit-like protein
VVCVQFNQNDQRMVPASERLYSAIVDRRLTLPNDPELARHSANATAKHSRRGWRISKPDDRTHIDGIVALAMAVERAEHRPEPVELLGWL